MKGQSSLEALIAVTILILVIALFLSSISNSYKAEIINNEIIQATVELESLAMRSNFLSTNTFYVKTPFTLPGYVGYTGGELTKLIGTKNVTQTTEGDYPVVISVPVLSKIGWVGLVKRHVANRLKGEPI